MNSQLAIRFDFSITSKGNGAIELPGVLIRLYDRHQDEFMFTPPGLLKNRLLDVNEDGYLDILLWGVAEIYDNEGKLNEQQPVVALLIYDSDQNVYRVRHKSARIDIYPKTD